MGSPSGHVRVARTRCGALLQSPPVLSQGWSSAADARALSPPLPLPPPPPRSPLHSCPRFEAEAIGDTTERFALVTDFSQEAAGASSASKGASSGTGSVPTSILLLSHSVAALNAAQGAIDAWLAKERRVGAPVSVSPAQLDDRVELLQGEVEAKTQGIKVRFPVRGACFCSAAWCQEEPVVAST